MVILSEIEESYRVFPDQVRNDPWAVILSESEESVNQTNMTNHAIVQILRRYPQDDYHLCHPELDSGSVDAN